MPAGSPVVPIRFNYDLRHQIETVDEMFNLQMCGIERPCTVPILEFGSAQMIASHQWQLQKVPAATWMWLPSPEWTAYAPCRSDSAKSTPSL